MPCPLVSIGVLGPTPLVIGAAKAAVVSLSTVKPVSLAELSVQLRFSPVVAAATVRFEGASGGTLKAIALIMSFSSWPRMWQCQTYSHPLFWTPFGVGVGLFVIGS